VLDLTKLDMIGETPLARMIDACKSTLSTFKVSYRCQVLSRLSTTRLASCKSLVHAEFGQANDYIVKSPYELLSSIVHFLKLRSQSVCKPLETLRLYECDKEVLFWLTKNDSPKQKEHCEGLKEL